MDLLKGFTGLGRGTGMEPIGYGNAGRLAQLRHALDAADAVARHLCSCPDSAGEAQPLLLKLNSIRAELDLLDSLLSPVSLPPTSRPYGFDFPRIPSG